jgi:hypothetical protein
MQTGSITVSPMMGNNARERAADHRILLRFNALGFYAWRGGVMGGVRLDEPRAIAYAAADLSPSPLSR